MNNYFRTPFFSLVLCIAVSLLASGQSAPQQTSPKSGGDFSSSLQPEKKVPAGVILVKGAWSSASDAVTAVPEGAKVAGNQFSSEYFGINYLFPPNWAEKYKGPPPSDSGRYVLAQINPASGFTGPARGTILITAQDMFFTPLPAANALELVNYSKDKLQADYKVEMPPTPTKIAERPFTFFAYWSPSAQLHWYVAATEIRCHAVEFILTSRDTTLLESLLLDMNKMKMPAEASPIAGLGGGDAPLCIKDYAKEENMISRTDPIFSEHRFNPVPVRIIIDKEGKVKHIHFLSAFPDQARAITDALRQWKFKPCLRGGRRVEVETGILFGRSVSPVASRSAESATE